jgi:hypothetical protein
MSDWMAARPRMILLAAVVIVLALSIGAALLPHHAGTFHGPVPSYLKR